MFCREIRKVLCGYPLLSIAMPSDYCCRKIFEVASSDNYDLLKEALKGVHGEILKEDLDLALLRAAANGNLECVKLLLDHGADIKAVDGNLDNALILATSNGHRDVVELLLRYGCPPNEVNFLNFSPLMKACENGYTEIVQLLLEYISFQEAESTVPPKNNREKPNLPPTQTYRVYYKRSPRGHTPLISAVMKNNISLVKMLLEAKAPVNEADFDKSTALHQAASNSSPGVLELLLEAKADVNVKNMMHLSPLMCAIQYNKLENINILLKHGADVNVTSSGRNVLTVAARAGTKEIMEALIETGVDLDHRDAHGNTPLFVAVQCENFAAIRCLIRSGCILDSPDAINYVRQWQKMTLFYFAIWKMNLDIVKILHAAGAFTNKILNDCYNDEKLREHCSGKPDLFDNLEIYASSPPHLMHLCRKSIREAIKKPLIKTVPRLTVPVSIKDFLLYSDIYFD